MTQAADLRVRREQYLHLASGWHDGGLWRDVSAISALCWEAQGNDELLTPRWHHLVMAVGNFKRQGGRRLRPHQLVHVWPEGSPVVRRDDFRVPPGFLVSREDCASWQRLESSLRGAATATATSLLAAVWPDDHHVLDWRVLAATAALALPANPFEVDPNGSDPLKPSMDRYGVARDILRSTAAARELKLATVERGLYELSRQVTARKGRKWQEYADELRAQIDRAVAAGADDASGDPNDENDVDPEAP